MRGGTEIGRVRGLGAAKSGVHHWWLQRVTAVAALLLVTWFVVSLLRLPNFAHATVIAWMKQPLVAVPMLLFVANMVWHARLGLQVLIEDYVAGGARVALLLALNFLAVGAAALGILSILKIVLG